MSKNIFYKDCCDKFVDYMKKSHITTQNEPKSEKATQDVQKNCLSLTELKDYAFYYTNDGIEQAHYCEVNGVKELVMPELDEVLAPVPSYEEWEQLQNWADFTNDYHELREKLEIADYKNAELKELLKEANKFLKDYGFSFDGKDCAEAFKVHAKINEVLK